MRGRRALGWLVARHAGAAPALMSAERADEACKSWNKDPVLTDKLVESGSATTPAAVSR